MNYKSFSLGDWIGHISGVIEDETTLDGNEMRDLVEFLSTLEQEPCADIMTIHTQGLDEGIRCAMCTNSMKSDRGCDGGCVVNEAMYKEVMNTIRNHIVPLVTPKPRWIPCDEKLPEDGELVLFSTKTDRVYEGRFFVDETDFQWYAFRDKAFTYNNVVTAWLPLPKPYKKDKESKE